MPFVEGDLVVRQLDPRFWRLEEALTYHGRKDSFVVPAGLRTDFASIPRLVVWLIPRYGAYTKAAILHDYLCENEPISRADADGLFRRALQEFHVSVPRRWLMWAAVRAASAMRGADAGQWFAFIVVAVLGLTFVAIPAIVVQVFLILFWIIELSFWLVAKALRQTDRPAPSLQVRTA
jgi:hypothetical protein